MREPLKKEKKETNKRKSFRFKTIFIYNMILFYSVAHRNAKLLTIFFFCFYLVLLTIFYIFFFFLLLHSVRTLFLAHFSHTHLYFEYRKKKHISFSQIIQIVFQFSVCFLLHSFSHSSHTSFCYPHSRKLYEL